LFFLEGFFWGANPLGSVVERITGFTFLTIAGSPIAIADLYSDIGSSGWVFTQPEVLALHKQGLVGKPLYHNGTPYSVDPTSRDTERWAGQLPDGSWVVALFNRGDSATVDKALHFSRDLGIAGSAKVRDVWARRDVGLRTEARATLAPHACALFHITPQRGVSRFHAAWAAWGGGANFNNDHAGYGGSGFVDKLEAGGDPGDPLVTFAVQAPRAGTYSVRWRYANGLGSPSTMTVSSERADRSVVDGPQRVSFPATAGWDAWDTVAGTLRLGAGLNLVTIGRGATDTGAVNLNWMDLQLG
jgi:alpha-glucosidase